MIEVLRECLDKDTKGSWTFYVKKPGAIAGGIVLNATTYDPVKEHASYQTLRPYLRMPKTKLMNHGDSRLVIQGVDGVPVSALIETDTSRAVQASEKFWQDTLAMWHKTVQPADETKYSRQMRLEKADSLDKIEQSEFIQTYGDLPVIVNEVEYPTLKQTIIDCQNSLRGNVESTMVLKHGDEQVDNILATPDNYFAIDPAWRGVVGYGPPSFPVNLFIGTNYNFYYHWQEQHQTNGALNIQLGLQERSVAPHAAFAPLFKQLLTELEQISPVNQFRENMFENFLRIAVGWVRRPSLDISELFTQPMVFVALASQVYYGDLI